MPLLLEPVDAAHGDVMTALFARRELGLRQEEIELMTDAELALHLAAWQYQTGRQRYVEDYAREYYRGQQG